MNARSGRIVVAVWSFIVWPQPVHAGVVESHWIPQIGDFGDPANWTGPVPDETVVAVFDVSFDPDPGPFLFIDLGQVSNRAIVRAGQAWFGLYGSDGEGPVSRTYQLMNPLVGQPSLVVGELAAIEASLTIFSGAVNTEMTVIGLDPGSVGAIDFGGAFGLNPSLSVQAKLHVGDGGHGSLIIDDDTIVACGSAVLGVQPGSSGDLVLSGTGAGFSAAGVTAVGSTGDGLLEVTAGAVIESGSAVVAQAQASFGQVLISGADSSWTVAGTMTIGGGGQATMTIGDDADVTSGSTIIGQQIGGVSDVTVSGVGTSWSIDGSLDVGMMGAGNLTISDGGAVFTQGTFVTIGTFPAPFEDDGGVGLVTVSDPGSFWFVDGDLYVGFIASGALAVLDGATVVSQNGVVGFDNQQSAALVDGFGSLWSNAGPLLVNTILTVTDDGRVLADSVFAEELEGDGTIQTVAGTTAASVTRVGDPVGTLSISGGFTTTELLVDLAAAEPGGYDRLAVAGPVHVVGSVVVSLAGGFVPQAGDSFLVITSNGIQGIPDVTLPILPAPLVWLVNHDGGSLELLVSKLGDTNGDGLVNVVDLLELLGLWGPRPGPCPADFNGDGVVSVLDLLILLANYDVG